MELEPAGGSGDLAGTPPADAGGLQPEGQGVQPGQSATEAPAAAAESGSEGGGGLGDIDLSVIQGESGKIRHFLGIINNLQTENARLKEGGSQPSGAREEPPARKSQPVSTEGVIEHQGDAKSHPYLKGLETNEFGEVKYRGTFMDPELAIDLEDQRREWQSFKSERQQESADREAARQQAEKEKAADNFFKGVHGMVDKLAGQYLKDPNLPEGRKAKVVKYMQREAEERFADIIDEHGMAGVTDDVVLKVAKDLMEDTHETFGVFGDLQLRKNAEAALRQAPGLGSGGSAKAGTKSMHEMTEEEREQHILQLERAAKAELGWSDN